MGENKFSKKFSELMEEAIEAEKDADSNYEKTIQETDNPRLESLLTSLRKDEIIHLALLENLKSIIEKKYEILKGSEENISDISLSLVEAKNIMDDIDAHIDAEKEQMKNLKEIIQMQEDMPIKFGEKIDWILEDEKRHHQMLKKVAQRLKREYNL